MASDTVISGQEVAFSSFKTSESFVLVPAAILFVDLSLLLAAWALVTILPSQSSHVGDLLPRPSVLALWTCLCLWFTAQGHYTSRHSFSSDASQIAAGILLAALVEWSMQFDGVLGNRPHAHAWLVALLLLPLGRLALKRTLFHVGPWRLPTAVVGTASQCDAIAEMLTSDWYRGFAVHAKIPHRCDGLPPTKQEVERLTSDGVVRFVLIAADCVRDNEAGAVARMIFQEDGVSRGIVLPLPGLPVRRLALDQFSGSGLVVLRERRFLSPQHRAIVKRGLDIAVSVMLLFLALPLMLSIAWFIRRDGGPVFYASQRLGHNGKLFSALKFRTMAPNADRLLHELLQRDPVARDEWETGFKLRHDPRITGVGRLLRELSLDELPQLINVLTGDMSLVGPRPLLPAERAAYGEAYQTYCQCIPGITGLWQVSGRNNLEYQRRIELNNWYADNASFGIDLIILFKTLSVVVRRVGAI